MLRLCQGRSWAGLNYIVILFVNTPGTVFNLYFKKENTGAQCIYTESRS